MHKKSMIFALCLLFFGMGSSFTEVFAENDNPAPFRPTSYFLKMLKDRLGEDQNEEPKNGPKSGKDEKNENEHKPDEQKRDEAKTEEELNELLEKDYQNAHSPKERTLEKYLKADAVVKICTEYLEPTADCPGMAMKTILNQKAIKKKNASYTDKLFLAELDRQFVKIPEGKIPVLGEERRRFRLLKLHATP